MACIVQKSEVLQNIVTELTAAFAETETVKQSVLQTQSSGGSSESCDGAAADDSTAVSAAGAVSQKSNEYMDLRTHAFGVRTSRQAYIECPLAVSKEKLVSLMRSDPNIKMVKSKWGTNARWFVINVGCLPSSFHDWRFPSSPKTCKGLFQVRLEAVVEVMDNEDVIVLWGGASKANQKMIQSAFDAKEELHVREVTLIYNNESAGCESFGVAGAMDTEVMFLASKSDWRMVKRRKRFQEETVTTATGFYLNQKMEAVAKLPSITLDEKRAILAGAPKCGNLTIDEKNPSYSKLPSAVKGHLPLCFRCHTVQQVGKWLEDFQVGFIVNLTPAHGFVEQAAVERNVNCVTISNNETYTSPLTKTLENFITTCVGTGGHAFYQESMSARCKTFFEHLFATRDVVALPAGCGDEDFAVDEDYEEP